MQAIVKLQKTGYYITHADGSWFSDSFGHMWFSKKIASETARRIGGWYEQGQRGTIKEVVIRYEFTDD